jgi:hypothetical protein
MKTCRAFRIVIVACVAVTLAATAFAADGDSLASILDECSELRLAEQGRQIKDKSIKVGHMEIGLADGVATRVLGKSGSVLGIYFEGHGGYVYTADEPADRAAMQTNLSRVAPSLRLVGNRVADGFKQLLILVTSPQFQDLVADDAGEAASTAPLAPGFRDLLAGAMRSYGEFDFRVAQTRLNGGGTWLYAEMTGGLERVGYSNDELRDGRERLVSFRKLADYATRFTETLSFRSLPGWDAARRRSVVLTKAKLDVATADNKSGTIHSDMIYKVRDAGWHVLPLHLFNNRDPDKLIWSSPLQKLSVKHVLDAAGKDLPFSHKYDELLVEIPPTSANGDLALRFETSGDVFVDMTWRHTDNYFTLGYTDWYPSPGWAGEHFTYTLKVKCKKPWRPVTSGQEVALLDEGDSWTAMSRSDVPSSLVTVFGGKYVTKEEEIDGLVVRIHAYAMARKNVLDNMPKLAAALVKTYTSMLGPMPATELDIVEVPEYGFGISPAGVILLTTEAYKPHQDEVANYFARGINARLAHEIAHQWFGSKVIPADTTENWLSESFAEYYAGLAMGALGGEDKTVFGFNKMILDWKAEDKYCADGAPISSAPYLGGSQGGRDRRCLWYSRGPLVLQMLRTSIGNERFFDAAKRMLNRANNGPATTADFGRALSEAVQMDMQWFVDQWIDRSGNAVVDVEQHVTPAADGQFRLYGTLRQTPGDKFKKLLIPLVWESDGKTVSRVVFTDLPEKTFEFMLPAKPGSVKVDPFRNNLAEYK